MNITYYNEKKDMLLLDLDKNSILSVLHGIIITLINFQFQIKF